MTQLIHLHGITSQHITTTRGKFHFIQAGSPNKPAVVFIHGNVSSSTFWEETMLSIAPHFFALAPDMRGYGESESLPVDATRGLRDFSDDIDSMMEALHINQFHLVGHSLGGGIVMQYTIDHAPRVRSLTLVAPASPFGFGGTRDRHGTPCWSDYAGSGGGLTHPEIIKRIAEGDRSEESNFSPRRLLRERYVCPPYRSPREDVLVESMLSTCTNEANYSRDMTLSLNWPNIAPGTKGVNNALSPKYCNHTSLAHITPKPPIFWVRGSEDQIVSDQSLSDPAVLGSLGLIPNWPGPIIYPFQPMVQQTRTLLEQYQAQGGMFEEHVILHVGHVPYLEEPEGFLSIWMPFLLYHEQRQNTQ